MINQPASVEIMIDIETLGAKEYSVITQVAMMRFSRNLSIDDNKLIKNRFFVANIDITKQEDRFLDRNTLKWWLSQDPVAIKAALNADVQLAPDQFIKSAKEWLQNGPQPKLYWAKPPGFDIDILNNLFKEYTGEKLIGFREERDVRTIMDSLKEFGIPLPPMVGTKHDALADVENQTNAVVSYFQHIKSALDILAKPRRSIQV